MSSVVTALKAEITELQNKMARDPVYQRMQELERMVTQYEEAPAAKGKGKRTRARACP